MNIFEKFYDETEKANVRFVGFSTEDIRYDFGIVYSHMFFGKPLVICMQTGRSALLDSEDLEDLDHLRQAFHLESIIQAKSLADFLKEAIPSIPLNTQYD
ncbi:DUF3055 domain-containing protein [Metabacillus arenae]|uniref:DUF3055 domain-containing protein n=1 Tax=Metabacillus arenae TaxID=2771434 RepID=A0A926NGZ7_9BACI|nr:DUF3055 domain-containing protein [Metabacillus arenae]MBD1380905.1 DUF3055 domain-containing protein [Metabacillus arenae]